MGVAYYPNYNYEEAMYNSDHHHTTIPTSSPSPALNSSGSIFSEYLSTGLSSAFLEKYNRELTVAASSLSVIILIILGTCLWCLVGLVKRGYDKKSGDDIVGGGGGGSSGSTSTTQKKSGDELDTSCSVSSVAVENGGDNEGKSSRWCGGRGRGTRSNKGIPIISKIFSKQNGNGARIMAQHRNIITPDRTIPFIIPTIQLPAQPSDYSRKPDSSLLFPDNQPPLSSSPTSPEPQPSSSRNPLSRHHNALLQAQQFFPQLEHPESDSCPLIAFSLYYEVSSQILNVRLLEGRNFPDSLTHTVAVKVYPGRASKQHTKEFKTRSPVYNQEFCFHVRKSGLHTKILKLRAVIPGTPKRVIGYVNVALKDLPGFDHLGTIVVGPEGEEQEQGVTEDLKTTQLWRRVELPSEGGEGVKLQVSLKWSPEPGPGLLTLKIIEAAGLHENRDCDYTSSYVKVTLQQQGRSIKTRKTALVRWGSVPVFDDVFVLTIPRELLPQISFLLVVMARGRLGSKAVLGKICVGPVPYSSSTSPSGTEFWEDMCHQPDLEIVRWLQLLP